MASLCIYTGYIYVATQCACIAVQVTATDEMKSSAFATVLALLLLALIKESIQQLDG